MTNELNQFQAISRQEWKKLSDQQSLPLTEKELIDIKSLNDRISIEDVKEIYLPLIDLLERYRQNKQKLIISKHAFLRKTNAFQPFIIGISGSVAVGKSTASRLLQLLLSRLLPSKTVELVTTDGFLYPNSVLAQKDLMTRKGFPESYDTEKLMSFLTDMKKGHPAKIPVYSHEHYDIVENLYQELEAPDILIVEGINVFQHPDNHHIYISDYFDFAIYIDAEVASIERWYLERFQKLCQLAVDKPDNFHHRFTHLSSSQALALAKDTWESINLVNLLAYIKPTRIRADVILHKSPDHTIDYLYLKE